MSTEQAQTPRDILVAAVRAGAPGAHGGVSCMFRHRTYAEDPTAWSVGELPRFRNAAGEWERFDIPISFASAVADAVHDLWGAQKAAGAPFDAVYVTLDPSGAAGVSFDEDPAAAG